MNMKQIDFMREYDITEGVAMKATARLSQYREGTGRHVEYPEKELVRETLAVLRKRAEYQKNELDKTIRTINDLKLKYRDRKERGFV